MYIGAAAGFEAAKTYPKQQKKRKHCHIIQGTEMENLILSFLCR